MTEDQSRRFDELLQPFLDAMTWTKNPPTKTGWYWYRGDHLARRAVTQPVVIYVVMLPGEGGVPRLHARVDRGA
jgi:hypothetical protein